MKKVMTCLLISSMLLTTPIKVWAEQSHISESSKPVIVIEVGSEEEYHKYPKDFEKYHYIFYLPVPNGYENRANNYCSECGSANVTQYNKREVIGYQTGPCPYSMGGLKSDTMFISSNKLVEKCGSCNTEVMIERLEDTYEAQCSDGYGTFEVRKEWSIETGHDLHEIYDYWYNPYDYI